MDFALIYKRLPIVFGTLAFIVNPIFVYLIFTEKSSTSGNYRYVLLYFATFNLVYTVVNLAVPMDIHSYRYTFYAFINDGYFLEQSDFNLHMLSLRCASVASSYGVLLSHFIYRYLVVQDSSLTRKNFYIFWILTAVILVAYTSAWHFNCYLLGSANTEIREYIRKDFTKFYGFDPAECNMISCLYQEGTTSTLIRSWSSTTIWTTISAVTICIFSKLAYEIMTKLKKMTSGMSAKTTQLQLELLRALIIQTFIPVFVGFLPCTISFFVPIFNLDLGRPLNYVEVTSLQAFAFLDPLAIVMCLPMFRRRVLCLQKTECSRVSTENMMTVMNTASALEG